MDELRMDRMAEGEDVPTESEGRYRELFESVPVGLVRTTPAGRALEVNRALLEMGRWPDRASYLATDVADHYVDPADRDRLLDHLAEHDVVVGFEVRLRRHDGTVFWASLDARTMRDPSGCALYCDVAVAD